MAGFLLSEILPEICWEEIAEKKFSWQYYLLLEFKPEISWDAVTEEIFSYISFCSKSLTYGLNHGLTAN